MHVLLVELPQIIKGILDILDLLVFRLTVATRTNLNVRGRHSSVRALCHSRLA
jgi:hypothetical protein